MLARVVRPLAAIIGSGASSALPRVPTLSVYSSLASVAGCSVRSFSAEAAAPAAAESAGPSTASPPAGDLNNLRLDKKTREMLARKQALDEAALTGYRDLAAPQKTLPVLSLSSAQPTGEQVTLDERVFSTAVRPDVVHRVIVWQEKSNRTTLYKGKTRSEVRGGGRKPWRQKGTGRARAGSTRSPLWVGGGMAHAPVLREWGISLPKKVRRLGMRVALAAKYRDQRLLLVDKLEVPAAKTKAAAAVLSAHGLEGKRVLFVGADSVPSSFQAAVGNIPRVSAMRQLRATVRDIVQADAMVITPAALQQLTERVTQDM